MGCGCNKPPVYSLETAIRLAQNMANGFKYEVGIFNFRNGFRFAKKDEIKGEIIRVASPKI